MFSYADSWEGVSRLVLRDVLIERHAQVQKYGLNEDIELGMGPEVYWLSGVTQDDIPLVDQINPRWLNAIEIESSFRADYEDHQRRTGNPTFMHLIREEVAEAFKESDPEKLEEELIQIAALCVSAVEKLRASKSFSGIGFTSLEMSTKLSEARSDDLPS